MGSSALRRRIKEMNNRLEPIIGHWYSHLDKGDLFQVVAIDRNSETIEVQEFDGGLDEFDFEEWRELYVEEAAAPEDWTGPVDDVETDDLGYSDTQSEAGLPESIENFFATWEEVPEEDEEVDRLPRRPPRQSVRKDRHRHH
jgi:hypothetical protein